MSAPVQLPVALIYKNLKHVRSVQPEKVRLIADSMKRVGLMTPITVRSATRVRNGQDADVWEIVTGHHRAAAARELCWQEIACVVFEGDEAAARLWEIAENLHRAELTEPERREHIAEWVRITGEKVIHSGSPLPGGAQPKETGIRKASKELGVPFATVRRAVAAESLPPSVKAAADAAGLGTVKRAEVARMPNPAAQLDAIRREREMADGHKRNQEIDRAISKTAAQEFAEWLLARVDLAELPQVISWLQGTKANDVIAALRREAA